MSVDTPQQPSYASQMSQTLMAQEQAQTGTGDFSSLGPLINLEQNPATGEGAWANLSLDTMEQLINGTPGGPATSTTPQATAAGWYDAQGNLANTNPSTWGAVPTGAPFAGISAQANPAANGLTYRPAGTINNTTTTNVAATPGLLALSGQISQAQAQQQAQALTTQRTSDISDVMNLGPSSLTATANADPATAALIAQMTGQASSDLALGANLNPAETRTATQAVRSQNQGMLGGTGNAGDYAAALGLSGYGQQLQQLRRQYAGSVIGQRQGFYGNAFSNVLNRAGSYNPGSAIAQAQGISAGSYNPYSPESQYAANIYGNNQQTTLAGSAAGTSATAGIIGGALSAVGGVASKI